MKRLSFIFHCLILSGPLLINQAYSQVSYPDCKCADIRNDGTYSQGGGADFRIDAPNLVGGKIFVSNGINAMFVGFGDGTALKKFNTLTASATQKWSIWSERGVVATDFAVTDPSNWADFVFNEKYRLRPLTEVESFIKANKHLPGIPSEQKIKTEGYTVHTMNVNFIQKIEELTLYIIDQDKKIKSQQGQIDELNARLSALENKR